MQIIFKIQIGIGHKSMLKSLFSLILLVKSKKGENKRSEIPSITLKYIIFVFLFRILKNHRTVKIFLHLFVIK